MSAAVYFVVGLMGLVFALMSFAGLDVNHDK